MKANRMPLPKKPGPESPVHSPAPLPASTVKIGVVSDTHNYLDPEVLRRLAGVDHILHAGDIGLPKILLQLEEVAPVTAVAGNTDEPHFRYPMTERVELGGQTFLVHHIVNPYALAESLQERITRERPSVVVFGHTHKPFCERQDGVLFFNPGYAGKPRFGMERSVAVLHLAGGDIRPEYFRLY